MSKKVKKNKTQDTLVKVRNMFETALEHPTWVSFRKDAVQCFDYKENRQWTKAELSVLKERKQPPTVNNQVSVTIERLNGQFAKMKTRIALKGRTPKDDPIAKVLSDIFLYIRQNSNLEFEESDMFDDGVTSGFGVLEVYVTFNDSMKPDIKIRHEDCLNVLPDPFSKRYDWNEDAAYINRFKWLDIDEAKELYPDYKDELEGMLDPSNNAANLAGVDTLKKDNYIDYKQRKVRIVETWYKDRKRESITINGRQIDQIKVKMRVAVFCGWLLLEDKESPHGHDLFPFIPYFVRRMKSGEPYSMIWIGLPMQDAINKRESKAIHLLNTNQAIYEKGSIEDSVELANQKADPEGQIEVRKIEQFQLHNNVELAATQYSLHKEGKQDFRRIVGINPDALGEKSEVRSGVGIGRKQAMTDMIIAPVFNNLRRTRILLGRLLLESIKNYWTEEMIFWVTDDANVARQVILNKDPEGRQILKEGLFDVIVEEMPDIVTPTQEYFETIGTLLPQIIPFGPFWVQTMIELSPLPNKQDIVKKITEAAKQQPTSDAKISVNLQWTEMTQFEKAAFAQKMGMKELAAMELKFGAPPQSVMNAQTKQKQSVLEAKIASLTSEYSSNPSEANKVELEMLKEELAMLQNQEIHREDMRSKKIDAILKVMEAKRSDVQGNINPS